MKNLLPLIIALLLLNKIVTAQETPTKNLKHALGAGAGFTTGYGLSYRYTPSKFGIQLNFAPYKTKETSEFSYGLTFLYTLIKNEKTSLYIYQANHFYYNTRIEYKYSSVPPYSTTGTSKVNNSYWNNGVGFGFEILLAKNVGLNLMTGYASYVNGEQLNITGETAIYFKF